TIDVPNDVITNITQITNDSDVITEVTELINNDIVNQGDIYTSIQNLIDTNTDEFIDNGNGTFTHIAVNGDSVTFDASTITMTKQVNGTYLLEDINGDSLTIDVPNDVITNITQITNDSDVITEVTELINNDIVNQGDIYTSIQNLIDTNTDEFIDNNDGTFTHIAVNGDSVTFDANTLKMVDNQDGTYQLLDANGDSLTIDVPNDVITNITQITNDSDVITEVTELINNDIVNQGDIYTSIQNLIDTNTDEFIDNNNGTFTHVAVNGDSVTFDASTITMTKQSNGTYLLEDINGDSLTIDVPNDVITNITQITNDSDVITEVTELINNDIVNQGDIYTSIQNLIDTNTDEFIDNNNGTFTHVAVNGDSVTFDANTLKMVDNQDGTYQLLDANGDSLTIDVPNDVITNITQITNDSDVITEVTELINNDIVNQGDIYTSIQNLIDTNTDEFIDNGNGTFTHVAVNGDSVTFDANTTTLTDNQDGTYTYKNEADSETIIKPVDYSNSAVKTGRKWIGNKDVYELTAEVNLATVSNVIDADAAGVPVNATLLSVRFINKTTKSISTNIIRYQSGDIILGTAGSMTTLHPAGDYYLIVEYVVE
ncbi:ribosomal protein L12E/L44/L45/RPP1/RPP2, partial [Mesonia hippocampi]|nr:ribosomal protein L12E/L44/L45/RPP1/RPP2 [Mesonia hippocampi]